MSPRERNMSVRKLTAAFVALVSLPATQVSAQSVTPVESNSYSRLSGTAATTVTAQPTQAPTAGSSSTASGATSAQVSPAQNPPATVTVMPAGPETLGLDPDNALRPPPLGADIFPTTAGPTVAARTDSTVISPNHIMRPGDRVRVTLWGLVNQEQEVVVDAQNNVVVPGVGPVSLNGVTAAQAPAVIEAAARRVYSSGVQIYAAASSVATTQVLVAGPVGRPGAYQGASDDALVLFLQRAAGIDANRGSYRRIRIVRQGETIATADLYEFLRAGTLPTPSFRGGDAIVVEEQGPTVAVTGDVRSAYSFELLGQTGQGAEIMRYARPRPGASHAAVVGIRNGQPYSAYLTLAEFAAFTLMDGDRVQFESDIRANDVLIRVDAPHVGPSVFSLQRGATVGQVVSQMTIDPDADWASVYLRRDSVRRTQKALLNEGLDRLERNILLSPSISAGQAAARASAAQAATQYIAVARQVEPAGIVPLGGRDLNSVLLESGDVIVIPRQSQIVSVAGEVQSPQSVVAGGAASVSSYVRLAGGFTPRADRRRILVFKPDGQLRQGNQVLPGDRVLVQGKPDSTLIALVRDLTLSLASVLVSVDRISN